MIPSNAQVGYRQSYSMCVHNVVILSSVKGARCHPGRAVQGSADVRVGGQSLQGGEQAIQRYDDVRGRGADDVQGKGASKGGQNIQWEDTISSGGTDQLVWWHMKLI